MPRRNTPARRKVKRPNKRRKFGPKNPQEDSYSRFKRQWDEFEEDWEKYIEEYKVEDLDGNEVSSRST